MGPGNQMQPGTWNTSGLTPVGAPSPYLTAGARSAPSLPPPSPVQPSTAPSAWRLPIGPYWAQLWWPGAMGPELASSQGGPSRKQQVGPRLVSPTGGQVEALGRPGVPSALAWCPKPHSTCPRASGVLPVLSPRGAWPAGRAQRLSLSLWAPDRPLASWWCAYTCRGLMCSLRAVCGCAPKHGHVHRPAQEALRASRGLGPQFAAFTTALGVEMLRSGSTDPWGEFRGFSHQLVGYRGRAGAPPGTPPAGRTLAGHAPAPPIPAGQHGPQPLTLPCGYTALQGGGELLRILLLIACSRAAFPGQHPAPRRVPQLLQARGAESAADECPRLSQPLWPRRKPLDSHSSHCHPCPTGLEDVPQMASGQ